MSGTSGRSGGRGIGAWQVPKDLQVVIARTAAAVLLGGSAVLVMAAVEQTERGAGFSQSPPVGPAVVVNAP